MTELPLRYDEAAYLAAYLRRLQSWDPRAAVRLQVHGSTLGVYGAPPLDCQSLVAVPLAGDADDHVFLQELDEVVSAGRLRDIIGDVSGASPRGVRQVRLPESVGRVAELAVLPPRGPWLPAGRAQAAEIRPIVTAAVTEFRTRSQALGVASASALDALAREVWGKPGWAGIPVGALHAASLLGFLAHDGLRVEAATCEGFKRLVAPGGQVLVRSTGIPARLSLAVLR